MDITKSITQLTVVHHQKAWHLRSNFSYKLEKKSHIFFPSNTAFELQIRLEFAVECISAKTSSNQLKTSVGRWQLAPGNAVQPTDQRLNCMTTASSLSVCPSSQAAKYHGRSPTKPWLQGLSCMLMGKNRLETILLMLAV